MGVQAGREDAMRRGLETFLAGEWGVPVAVEGMRHASAGARRQNVLFDARRRDELLPLAATVVPNPAMQVMDIEVEAASLRLAESAGVPVPHVHAVTKDPAFLGGPFFVASRIDGATIPREVLRTVAAGDLGPELARQCGEALAMLHGVDAARAHARLPRPAGVEPAAHALALLEPAIAALLQPSPAFVLALRWLERQLPPPPPRLAVLHGDFRNGNIIVGREGLRAALDWEVGHLGDPMEDLGWLCQRMWRFRNDTLEVGGFARREHLRAGYEAAGGRFCAEGFHWWKVLGTLRWGLGLAGQAAAHLDGSVPSIVMAASGRRVAELEYDLLMLLRSAYA